MAEKKLKIGILVDQLVAGGVQKSAIEEAKTLKKSGHEVTLFVLVRYDYQYQYHDLSKGLEVIFLSDYNPWPFKKAFFIPYFAFLTHLHILNPFFVGRYKFLKKLDFIISHGTTTCITAEAISKKLKIPYMAFVWDPMLFIWEKVYEDKLGFFSPVIKRLIFSYERSFLAQAAIIATSSKVHQSFIKNVYQVDPLIIHPACIPPKEIPLKKNNLILGYTRWELKKNPQLFLWLATKLPHARFLLAGSWTNPKEEEAFNKFIKEQKLEKRIKLISPIARSDLKKIAAQCIAWVHPNFEAFGISGLEMASLGLPIIIPKGSGVTELFIHGKHGYFPHKEKKEEFLSYLHDLMTNPKKATRMGQAAAKVGRSYTWKRHTKLVLKNIQEYLKKTKIFVVETGHAIGTSLAGGDKLMEPMARRLSDKYIFSIIVPEIGSKHWLNAPLQKELIILPSNRFDESGNPVPVFISYCIRMLQIYKILIRKISPYKSSFKEKQIPSLLNGSSIFKTGGILYSSTNILPDILPVYLVKRKNPDLKWIARIHHLIPPPHKRQGRFFVNVVSYCMQVISLALIKGRSDLTITLNKRLKDELISKGFQKEKLAVLGAGVEVKKISTEKIIAHTKIYHGVFLGRLHPTKGIYDLITIWKNVVLNIPSAKLAIIGFGQQSILDDLRRNIIKENLSRNIYLLGYISDEKVYSILKKAKVFLFTDHEAGWGIAVAEAMANGLPVVGYDIGILGTVYRKGFTKVPLEHYKKFAQEITKILMDNALHMRMSKEARLEAKRLDWAETSKKFHYIIQKTITKQ